MSELFDLLAVCEVGNQLLETDDRSLRNAMAMPNVVRSRRATNVSRAVSCNEIQHTLSMP